MEDELLQIIYKKNTILESILGQEYILFAKCMNVESEKDYREYLRNDIKKHLRKYIDNHNEMQKEELNKTRYFLDDDGIRQYNN